MKITTKHPRPCGITRCPALTVDGHEFCALHSPLKVLERARAIVKRHLDAHRHTNPLDQDLDHAIAAILRELDDTV